MPHRKALAANTLALVFRQYPRTALLRAALCAVTDPELLHVLPSVLKHIPLPAVGCLRETCTTFRSLPCVLATPVLAHDYTIHSSAPQMLDSRHTIDFLLSLPNLQHIRIDAPKSLFGFQYLTQLSSIKLTRATALDYRPLQAISGLRHLELNSGADQPLYCLDELTFLTSLVMGGDGTVSANILQLTNLQELDLGADCSFQGSDWKSLPNLTSLKAASACLVAGLEDLPHLQRLHSRAGGWQADLDPEDALEDVEICVQQLPACTALSALTLHGTPRSGRDLQLFLNPLHHLPNLQTLELGRCCPRATLQLSALTALTFFTSNAKTVPIMGQCSSLLQVHIFVAAVSCVLSSAHVPNLGPLQRLHIKYTLGFEGRLLLNSDLLNDLGQVSQGLCVQRFDSAWPHDDA